MKWYNDPQDYNSYEIRNSNQIIHIFFLIRWIFVSFLSALDIDSNHKRITNKHKFGAQQGQTKHKWKKNEQKKEWPND